MTDDTKIPRSGEDDYSADIVEQRQRFIEAHGGWVELESEEGQGTHVTCYLPKEAPSESGQPELNFKIVG